MYNKKIIGLALASALASTTATAGLYINPVIKGSVKATPESEQVVDAKNNGSDLMSEMSSESVANDHVMKEGESKGPKVMSYGENVPLSIALKAVIPNSSDWLFKYDEGLEDMAVSWDGGDSWEGVVAEISESNPVNIVLNHSEKVVGVAIPGDLASALASRTAKVFKLDSSVSLRKNLSRWAEKAGYQDVIFTSEVRDIDYMVPDALFLGALNVKGGALDQLLMNLNEDARVPLEADFKEANKVILIMKKKSKKEMY